MTIPQPILDLIQRFDDNAAEYRGEAPQYRSLAYNETEVRREFIDPFFKALGWDVDNTQGYSEKYKEVVHEARVTVGGRVKAFDYAFREQRLLQQLSGWWMKCWPGGTLSASKAIRWRQWRVLES